MLTIQSSVGAFLGNFGKFSDDLFSWNIYAAGSVKVSILAFLLTSAHKR